MKYAFPTWAWSISLFLSQPTSLWSLFFLSVQPRWTDHKQWVLVPAFPTKMRHRHSTEEAFAQNAIYWHLCTGWNFQRDLTLSQRESTFSVHVVTGVSSSRLLATASSLDLTLRVSFCCRRMVQQKLQTLTKQCLLHVLCVQECGTASPESQGWVDAPPKQQWGYRGPLVVPHTWTHHRQIFHATVNCVSTRAAQAAALTLWKVLTEATPLVLPQLNLQFGVHFVCIQPLIASGYTKAWVGVGTKGRACLAG